jgi:hypothetical protein
VDYLVAFIESYSILEIHWIKRVKGLGFGLQLYVMTKDSIVACFLRIRVKVKVTELGATTFTLIGRW